MNEEDYRAATVDNANAKAFANNQRWNPQICGIFGNFTVIIILLFTSTSFVLLNSLLKGLSLTTEEKAQIDDHLNEITIQIVVPVVKYIRNSKLRQHVKYEIFN